LRCPLRRRAAGFGIRKLGLAIPAHRERRQESASLAQVAVQGVAADAYLLGDLSHD